MCHLYFKSMKSNRIMLKVNFLKRSIMKYKNNKKRYSVYASLALDLYFLTFVEMKYTSSILLSLKRNKLIWETHFKILLSVNINT